MPNCGSYNENIQHSTTVGCRATGSGNCPAAGTIAVSLAGPAWMAIAKEPTGAGLRPGAA